MPAANFEVGRGSEQTLCACQTFIIDYGAGGVCLQVNPGVVLPKRFELIHGAIKKKCRVAWVNGRKIGVAFQ
jgi:hypothetical protein